MKLWCCQTDYFCTNRRRLHAHTFLFLQKLHPMRQAFSLPSRSSDRRLHRPSTWHSSSLDILPRFVMGIHNLGLGRSMGRPATLILSHHSSWCGLAATSTSPLQLRCASKTSHRSERAWMAWEAILSALQWQSAVLHVVLASAWMMAAWARLWAAREEKRWWTDNERTGRRGRWRTKTAHQEDLQDVRLRRRGSVEEEEKLEQPRRMDGSQSSSDGTPPMHMCDHGRNGTGLAPTASKEARHLPAQQDDSGDASPACSGVEDASMQRAFRGGDPGADATPPACSHGDPVSGSDKKQGSRSNPNSWPSVTLILPVHGLHSYSVENFQLMLRSRYPSKLEAIFVSAHAEDAGLLTAGALREQATANNIKIRLLQANRSKSCSQKLHNMMEALEHAEGELVFFLDDDVCIHTHTIERLAEFMCRTRPRSKGIAANPVMTSTANHAQDVVNRKSRFDRVVMATGYPLDIPARGANLAAYCKMGWHMPLLVGFSIDKYAPFVWGGCMMIWRNDLAGENSRLGGLYRAWSDGGYSDDLIAAAWCSSNNLLVAHPSHALLPMRIEEQCSWWEVWNYIHRQMYVLDTYADESNRKINHAMLRWQAYLSAATIWPLFISIVVWLGSRAGLFGRQTNHTSSGMVSFLTLHNGLQWSDLYTLEGSGVALCVSAWLSAVALWCMLRAARLQLEYSYQTELQVVHGLKHANWFKMILGFWICQALVPFAAIVAMQHSEVTWGETVYRKRRGKVTPIHTVSSSSGKKGSERKKE